MNAEGVAVVTGASRGIGRAVAVELHARGFEVVATMRDPSAGEGLPAGITVQALDVTRPDGFTPPDGLKVLVNNAAIERDYLPAEVAPLSMWREMFDTNLFGLLAVTQPSIPALRKTGGGVICNVTSSSILAPMPFYAAYRASKAAVSALGESLRAELAPFGIRVVEILPGPVDTDMYAESQRPVEAHDHEPYRPLAEQVSASRASRNLAATSPADAAVAIVDAICDDGGPLRYGCDPLSAGMLDAWRGVDDERWMRAMLKGFGIKLP